MKKAPMTIAFALACAVGSASSAINAAPDSEGRCTLPEGWDEVTANEPRFIIFGESHGTREGPAFVGEVLCALARRGEKVLLATELTSTHDARLQAAWAQPMEAFADALRSGGWEQRDDGVGSVAMSELVTLARRLKEDGHEVGVTAFNGARDEAQRARFAHLPAQGPHEAAQAENIYEAAEAGGYTRVLVLVGSFHAVKRATRLGGVEMEPMAVKLARMGPSVSLTMRYAGGASWSCQARSDFDYTPGQPVPSDAIVCGEHPSGGYGDPGEAPHMALGAFRGRPLDDYDGYFWVGPISASPPAIRDQDDE